MLANSQKFMIPFIVSVCVTCNCASRAKIKICSHLFVCLVKCFPKLYVMIWQHQWPWRRQTTRKRTVCRPSPTGWGLDMGTSHPIATNQTTPENFVQVGSSIQKLFTIFQNTDTQTERHTNESPLYHIWVKKNCPIFSTFSLTRFVCFARSLRFVQDKLT